MYERNVMDSSQRSVIDFEVVFRRKSIFVTNKWNEAKIALVDTHDWKKREQIHSPRPLGSLIR